MLQKDNYYIVPLVGTPTDYSDKNRGTVVADGNSDYDTDNLGGFGDKTLHTFDYGEYYVNLRENGLKRASAFLGHKIKVGEEA